MKIGGLKKGVMIHTCEIFGKKKSIVTSMGWE
jgi:hypothetical protein